MSRQYWQEAMESITMPTNEQRNTINTISNYLNERFEDRLIRGIQAMPDNSIYYTPRFPERNAFSIEPIVTTTPAITWHREAINSGPIPATIVTTDPTVGNGIVDLTWDELPPAIRGPIGRTNAGPLDYPAMGVTPKKTTFLEEFKAKAEKKAEGVLPILCKTLPLPD